MISNLTTILRWASEIGIDAAARISTVSDPKRQVQVARAIRGLRSHDARKVIDYVKMQPDLPVSECAKRVLESRTVRKKVRIVILGTALSPEEYSRLKERARSGGVKAEDLARELLLEALAGREGKRS